jgi:hypothetical protein
MKELKPTHEQLQDKTLFAQAQIDHYVKELKQELGTDFTSEAETQFRVEAKESQQQNLFNFANSFLEQQRSKQEMQQNSILKERKERREKELQQASESVKTDKKKTEAILKEHFEDRITAKSSDFVIKGKKPGGGSDGCVVTKKTNPNGIPFMMKLTGKFVSQHIGSFVNEFITGPLYKRTLYDRAPIIEGVTEGAKRKNSKYIYLRSKYLPDFTTVAEFTNWKYGDFYLGKQAEKLKEVKDPEKVFAAILAWGEGDVNSGNIAWQKGRSTVTYT